MLKKVKIENFKSYKKSELVFHSGVNVIVGMPQSGKTNILRAIRQAVFNRIKYDSKNFKANKKSKINVKLTFDDFKYGIEKSKTITKLFADNEEYKTGNRIPDIVEKKINMDSINFQNQLDKPFLITSSHGKIAKAINKAINLDAAGGWLKNLTEDINAQKRKVDYLKSDLEELDLDIKKTKAIKSLKKDIKQYNYLGAEWQELDNVEFEIGEASGRIIRSKKEIKKLKELLKYKSLLERYDEINDYLVRYEKLLNKINSYFSIKKIVKKIKGKIALINKELSKVKFCPTCKQEMK